MNSLYIDNLTGMPNLFGLLACPLEETFGNAGVFLFIDAKKLSVINQDFGHAQGDQYLRTLSAVLDEQIFAHYPKSARFRVGGDTFLLHFPEGTEALVEQIGQAVDAELHRRMEAFDIHFAGIHFALWTYTSPIPSVAQLMKQCSLSLFSLIEEAPSSELPRWADSVIRDLFLRVQETLSLLETNHALAHLDDVSGLPNHRAARQVLARTESEHQADGRPYAVLFIDGDNLKRYNECGYAQGNRMIRGIADHLKASLREADRVFRWLSGDEFLVILPHADPDMALEVSERLRTRMEKETLGWTFPVTISIGVACYPLDGVTSEALMELAERRNAQAKRLGKNRTVHSGDGDVPPMPDLPRAPAW